MADVSDVKNKKNGVVAGFLIDEVTDAPPHPLVFSRMLQEIGVCSFGQVSSYRDDSASGTTWLLLHDSDALGKNQVFATPVIAASAFASPVFASSVFASLVGGRAVNPMVDQRP